MWLRNELVQVLDKNQSLMSYGVLPSKFHPFPGLVPCRYGDCVFEDITCPYPGLVVEVSVVSGS